MTREERNIKLKHLITCMKCEVSGNVCDDNCPTQYEAGNMGEIIENLETISKMLEQEPCEDAISRKALFDMCKKEIDYISKNWQNYHSPSEAKLGFAYIATNIYDLPPVTLQPKTGHWIRKENKFIVPSRFNSIKEVLSTCSVCASRYIGIHEDFNYCPNCGARMIEK